MCWDSGMTLEQYISRMRSTNTWGGAIEIKAFCEIYHVSVCVYSSRRGKENNKLIAHFYSSTPSTLHPVIKIEWSGGHYEPIRIQLALILQKKSLMYSNNNMDNNDVAAGAADASNSVVVIASLRSEIETLESLLKQERSRVSSIQGVLKQEQHCHLQAIAEMQRHKVAAEDAQHQVRAALEEAKKQTPPPPPNSSPSPRNNNNSGPSKIIRLRKSH